MMLQKTSSRIKQYLSHRKGLSGGEGDLSPEVEDRTGRQYRSKSWISQVCFKAEDLDVKGIATFTNAQSPPDLPCKSAHSSDSSLYSCDSNKNASHGVYSLSHESSAVISSKLLCPDSIAPPSAPDGIREWNAISPGPPASLLRSSVPPDQTDTRKNGGPRFSRFDLMEALKLESLDGDKTPTQASCGVHPSVRDENWSAEVEALIRETDEAFKAIGFALSDAKLTMQDWYPDRDISTVHWAPSRVPSRKQHRGHSTRTNSTSVKKRNFSPMKRANRKSREIKVLAPKLSPAKLTTHLPKPVPSPRWTLNEVTDGVVEIFNNKIFHRLEADEMLTPSRVQQIKLDTQAKRLSAETIKSTSTASTDEVQTPLEPFHLEDLSFRISASSASSTPFTAPPSPAVVSESPSSPETPPIPDKNDRRSLNVTDARIESTTSETNASSDPFISTGPALLFRSLSFPSPPESPRQLKTSHLPPVPTHRAINHFRGPSNLTTIPEVSPLTPKSTFQKRTYGVTRGRTNSTVSISPMTPAGPRPHTPRRSSLSDGVKATSSPNIGSKKELESTPFSLTSPTFRHGSIRLMRPLQSGSFLLSPDISPLPESEPLEQTEGLQEPKFHNETLDWIAFQMAISGGTGDYLMSGGYGSLQDESQEIDEKEVEELLEWWHGLGIEVGGLVDGEVERRDKSPSPSQDTHLPSSRASMIAELPDTCSPNLSETGARRPSGVPLCLRPGVIMTQAGPEIFEKEATEIKRTSRSRESKGRGLRGRDEDRNEDSEDSDGNSLPPSPMLDFNPSGGGEVVPMGFNLNHDLGDFLRWEAEHVGLEG